MRTSLATIALAATLAAFAGSAAVAETTFPHAEADSLTGKHTVFPDALRGRPAVVLVAVDRESADQLNLWATKITTAPGPPIQAVSVVAAEGAPPFVRGFIKRAVAKDVPPEARGITYLTFDATGWKSVMTPGKKQLPQVVVINAAGTIVYTVRTEATDAAVAEVLKAIP